MFKKLIKKIFMKHFDLQETKPDDDIETFYTSLGMVKSNIISVKYYATPTLASQKCLKASRKKYGFKEGDSIEKMFDDVYSYYETISE